jgi:hypothetical protein
MEIAEVLSGFRRRLVLRLLIVGVLASVLAGASAFFIETERLEETLVDQAVLEARALASVLNVTADRAAPQRKLKDFLEDHAVTNRDFFVLAEMYDGSLRPV